MGKSNYDVIIIGGGVFGISLAYHLGIQKISAMLLEAEPVPAAHSSGKNAGMMRQLYRHPQLTAWAQRSQTLWPDELKDIYFRQTGSLIVGRSCPAHHPELFENRLHGDLSAVYTATDGLLDSPGYVNALHQRTDRSYISARFSTRAVSLTAEGSIWTVSTEDEASYSAPRVVLGGGAWANALVEPYGEGLLMQPFARHLFVVQGFPQGYMPTENVGYFWDEHHGWYLRLWDSESRLVSVCDRTAATPETFVPRPDVQEEVAVKLLETLPEIGSRLRIGRSWYCFRTYTEDQLPVWGEDPNLEGIFWLAAFGGFGMSVSFAACLDAAEYICGSTTSNFQDFSPARVKHGSSYTLMNA